MDTLNFDTDFENFPAGTLDGATVLSWRTCLDGASGPSGFWRQAAPTPEGGSQVRAAIVELDPLSIIDCNGNGVPDSNELLAGAPDVNGNLILDECECLADVNGDELVDVDDLLVVLAAWGQTGSPGLPGDADWSGVVDVADILIVLDAWGTPCP